MTLLLGPLEIFRTSDSENDLNPPPAVLLFYGPHPPVFNTFSFCCVRRQTSGRAYSF